jgi:hypothetical protein
LPAAVQEVRRPGPVAPDGCLPSAGERVGFSSHLKDIRRLMPAAENIRLVHAIAAACAAWEGSATAQWVLVGRSSSRAAYIVTVMPLGTNHLAHDCRLALILVVNPEQPSPAENGLSDMFGLSPAERRLAVALADGKKLGEIARVCRSRAPDPAQRGFRKVGVERQMDLIRALSSMKQIF